jgi:hypothetical protein
MPASRIVTTGLVVFASSLFLVATGSGTRAQTAIEAAPGKPIPLLQVLTPPDKAKPKVRRKSVSKALHRTHLAVAAKKRPIRMIAAATPAATTMAAAAPVPAAPALVPVAPVSPAAPTGAEPVPGEITVAGQTVQVVPADDVNAIDLAGAADSDAAAGVPAIAANQSAEAEPPPAQTAETATAPREHGEIGSAAWIAQALAAFGGAVAAGSLAWFLIGSAPQRMYG